MRVYRHESEYYVIWLDYHIDRFTNSASESFFTLKENKRDIKKIILTLLKKNPHITHPYLRLIIFFDDKNLSILPSSDTYTLWIWISDLYVQPTLLHATFSLSKRSENTLWQHKLSLNYGGNLIELSQARRKGYDCVLLIDVHNNVVETVSENIFIISGWKVYTPPLGNIVKGVYRTLLIEYFSHIHKLPVEEIPISQDFILSADEVFICGSATLLRPIHKINGQEIWAWTNNYMQEAKKFLFEDLPTYKNFGWVTIDTMSL
jgi:branched-chain amino acid aminotransferase